MAGFQLEMIMLAADGELFPFDLKRHEIDAPIDSDYLEMAESVKMRTGCLAQNDITTNLKKVICPLTAIAASM